MTLAKSFIPYGSYWSTPFCRWQGSLGGINAVELAARTAAGFLAGRKIAPETFDGLVLGLTVPQRHSFYGAPWLAGMIGAGQLTGPTVSQACATSARALFTAASEIELGMRRNVLVVACDRTSNGPHVYYPNPSAPGGRGDTEEWVWDNFNKDPYAKGAMISTAEAVAKKFGITKEEQDEITLLRHGQYQAALANDRAFQKRYMFPVQIPKGKKEVKTIDADEGVFPTTKEGLAGLKPATEGGTVSFGTQTFPADGNAGIVVCTKEEAARLSKDASLTIRIVGFGEARVEKGHMPMAVVPAARAALESAGIDLNACQAIKTHNPFAVNDAFFCRETGVAKDRLNQFGSPLVYGHPQGPTGLRVIMELIEELVQAGGGYGLFSGCAAGDTAMAVVVKVG
ncbi:MAG: thiolase family protein [Planctomycetes bacterium]|nr:thiolase family protein [Planctomycetota bacterium]